MLKYKNVKELLETIYPNENWDELFSKSNRKPQGYWDKIENQRAYFKGILEKKFNIQNPIEWKDISTTELKKEKYFSSLMKINGGYFPLLKNIYPTIKWNELELIRVPRNYWKKIENQRKFFDDLGKKLEIKHISDWKNISWNIICSYGGTRILQYYKSHFYLLKTIYPEYNWDIFEFSHVSKNFWNDKENHKKFLDYFYDFNKLKSLDDWNTISVDEFSKFGGRSILSHYSNMTEMLVFHYPNHNWCIFNRKNLPRGFWKDNKNHIVFLDRIAKIFNVHSPEDWKKISFDDILQNGGSSFFLYYDSIYDALIKNYPDKNWNIFDVKKHFSQNFFQKKENQMEFLNYLMKKENLNEIHQLISIPLQNIRKHGGFSLLLLYKNEWIEILKENYPHIIWDPSKLHQTPSHFWDDLSVQRDVFNRIGKQLGVEKYDDWYHIHYNQIASYGGSAILNRYSSLFDALENIFPEFDWNISKRKNVSSNFWNNRDNVIHFLHIAKEQFKIKEHDDWYRLSFSQLKEIKNGPSLLRKYKSIFGLLHFAFPDENWDKLKFSKRDKRSGQRWLFLQLQELFPGVEIIEDFYHAGLSKQASFSIQLDVFIPSRNQAFEFHGEHHYSDIPAFGHVELQMERDRKKLEICGKNGIDLKIVPHWWDGKLDSLRDLIGITSEKSLETTSTV